MINRITVALLTIMGFCMCNIDGLAQVERNPLNDRLKDDQIKIQSIVRANAWLKEFGGVVIAAKDGEVFYKHTAGYANFNYKVHNALLTQYNTCHITESITATAVMQLFEKNKIDLNISIKEYVPQLPENMQAITVHQLLTHSSGLFDYGDTEEFMTNFLEITKIEYLLSLVFEKNLLFEPGSEVRYSQTNYVMLAYIIEKVTQKKYEDYITEKILIPAGMGHAAMHNWQDTIMHKAIGYQFDVNGNPKVSANFKGAFRYGANSLYAGVEDILSFEKALESGKLISPKTRDVMYNNKVFQADSVDGKAVVYGWKTYMVNGKKMFYQGGSLGGLSTQIRRYDDGYTFIIFSNYNEGTAERIAVEIEEAIYQGKFVPLTHPLAYFFYREINKQGANHIIDNFDEVMKSKKFKLDKVWTLNALGRQFIRDKKLDVALAVFKLNASLFPDEPIVYDSLGECYYWMKDADMAIRNFEKRLELLPNDRRARVMIDVINEDLLKTASDK